MHSGNENTAMVNTCTNTGSGNTATGCNGHTGNENTAMGHTCTHNGDGNTAARYT